MNPNSNFPKDVSLQQFLESLPKEIPLQAAQMASSSGECIGQRLSELISKSNHPKGAMTTAMLWLRVAMIDPAHDIVQSSSAPLASYLHGVVHRLEGDYWNSKYWFRQVRDNNLMQTVSSSVAMQIENEGLLQAANSGLLMNDEGLFSPAGFVSVCEQHLQHKMPSPDQADALTRIAWMEWVCLWDFALKQGSQSPS